MSVLVRFVLAALLFGVVGMGTAQAQQQAGCKQSGNVTPGHIATWTTNCVLQDGGTPANPQITGGVGVASGNQQSICTQNSKSGAVSQLCLGSPPTGGVLTFSTLGGGGALPFQFVINGVTYTWPFPSAPINVPFLAATSFGVVGDGVTSNDVALANALTACTNAGTALYLPPGQIKLTGTATSTLTRCAMIGTGPMAGEFNNTASLGTTFLLTSTTVQPFILGQNFGISHVNFYWPNQTTGTTSYPPLFTGNGTADVAHGWMDHVVIVNAYDGIVQPSGSSWGDVYISNSNFYAVHDVYNFNNLSDAWTFANIRYTPGSWLNITNNAAETAIVAAWNAGNKLFHATAGGQVNFSHAGGSTYAIAIGVYVDTGASFAGVMSIGFDGVQSVIDASASSGGLRFQNDMTGSAVTTCGQALVFSGSVNKNTDCFKLGTSSIKLNGFESTGSWGNFISSTGSSVIMVQNSSVEGVGFINDGSDYSVVKVTGAGADVQMRGNRFVGNSPKTHGITTNGNVWSSLDIQNNRFFNFTDDVAIDVAAVQTIVTGNASTGTTGAKSLVITGTAPGVIYGQNSWDKPPLATVSACGTGATIVGTTTGFISVGSTNPTATCTLTLPFTLAGGGGGSCTFTPSFAIGVGATVSGLIWSIVTASDVHGGQIFFNCPGQQ